MNTIDIIQTLLLIGIVTLLLYKKPAKSTTVRNSKKLILDSCALIDGRIIELVNAGFVHGELVVPRFILKELQLLADGSDSQKRERARFGLDVAKQLQEKQKLQGHHKPSGVFQRESHRR